jgi:Na+/H+ antiporter
MSSFETILGLLLASTALAVAGKKLKLPIPIVMVIGGLAIALVPGLHAVEFDPDLTFAIFVPPLLFRASITTSLRGLRENLRSVSLLAVGLVAATVVVVGAVAHQWLGLPWAPAFVLGAILAPPDAIVGISLARALKAPRTVISIIEGETLLNDTTAFVLYRRAVAAVVTGSFSLIVAGPEFLLTALGGIGIGYVVYRVVRWARNALHDPTLENVIWLLVPFLAYLPAEAVGASGVLSVVVAGLLLRQSSPLMVSPQTRLQANHAYDLVEFMLNSLIFVLIGLEVGQILRAPQAPPLLLIARSAGIVSVALIALRVVWMYPGAFLPAMISKRIREREGMPSFKAVTLLAWMGVRGGDSLVTALALPLTIANRHPFPHRELIISTTFGVILATLLVQGLTLRPLIKLLKLPEDHTHEAEEALARREMVAAGDARLATLCAQGKIPQAIVDRVQRAHVQRSELEMDLADPAHAHKYAELQKEAEKELLRTRRHAVVRLRNEDVIDDEVLRHLERELDLEEMRLEITVGVANDDETV